MADWQSATFIPQAGPKITPKEYELVVRKELMARIVGEATEQGGHAGFIEKVDAMIKIIEREIIYEDNRSKERDILSGLLEKLHPYKGTWIHLP